MIPRNSYSAFLYSFGNYFKDLLTDTFPGMLKVSCGDENMFAISPKPDRSAFNVMMIRKINNIQCRHEGKKEQSVC